MVKIVFLLCSFLKKCALIVPDCSFSFIFVPHFLNEGSGADVGICECQQTVIPAPLFSSRTMVNCVIAFNELVLIFLDTLEHIVL